MLILRVKQQGRQLLAGRVLGGIVLGCALLAVMPAPLRGETLGDALKSAYRSNPRLLGERAALRATDEEVARAKSGWRPRLSVGADYGYDKRSNDSRRASDNDGAYGYSVNASQPIFSGFRTLNAVGEARSRVRAGREDLRRAESAILLDAATAYADVYRDQKIVRHRDTNLKALSRIFNSVQRLRKAGEATRAEVAQSRARLAGARASLAAARAQLKISRSAYKRFVGHLPGRLARPHVPPTHMPHSLAQAQQLGLSQSPVLLAAAHRNEAAEYVAAKVRGELLPSVSIEASHSRRYGSTTAYNRGDATSVLGRVKVPLYQGGEVWSRLRQAKHQQQKSVHDIQEARRLVEASISAAWFRLISARQQLKATSEQVRANRVALSGTENEYEQGQVSLRDLLDTQEDLNNSLVSLARAKRDLVATSFNLLASLGSLHADRLDLDVLVYDAEKNYEQLSNKWFGMTIRYADGHTEKMHVSGQNRD